MNFKLRITNEEQDKSHPSRSHALRWNAIYDALRQIQSLLFFV